MKALLLTLLVEAVVGQFSGFFGSNDAGGQCDYRALMQAVNNKERCYKEFLNLKKEAMQAIQQVDPSCNRGMLEGWQTCDPLWEPWLQRNDLDTQGIMECCLGSKVGGSQRRQCEFKNKPMPDGFGKKGKKGRKGRGSGERSGERGGRGGPMGGMDDMERMWKAKKTLAGCALESMDETLHMVKHLGWCMEDERPVNMQAVTGPLRNYKDKLIAKAWECYTPFMQVATNCTDMQYQDLECLGKGVTWMGMYKMDCIFACHPDSLSAFCDFFKQAAGQQASNSFNNNFNSNQNFNNNNNQFNRNNNNNNNNNRNDFFDPFGF